MSGGISNCAYQIGFLKALSEFVSRDEVKILSCSSAGISVGYAFSANKLDYVESLYKTVNISKGSELLWQVFAKGLLKNYIATLVEDDDMLEIPLCFPVCYIPIWSIKYNWIKGMYNRQWKKYLIAATNYPFLKIIPSIVDGRLAIDGGAIDNIPLFPLLHSSRTTPCEKELDLIFVLHFDARYDYRREFKTDIPVLDLDLSYCNNFSKAHYDYSTATISDRIDKAYNYGIKIASRLFSGDDSKEYLQKTINEIFLEEHTQRQQNFSLDRMFSFLNVAGKIFRNDNHCMKKLY